LPKINEKLRKIILLLITWGVLLGLFIGYENYFVAGQKEYLIDQEFRNLSRLSEQLNAEFDRARFSVSSLAKIVQPPNKPQRENSSKAECWQESNIASCFEEYAKTYLEEVWDRDGKMPDTEGIKCLGAEGDKARLQQDGNSPGLEVIVLCPQASQPQGKPGQSTGKPGLVLRMNMKPWVEEAFRGSTNSFDDVLVADGNGHVRFQMSATGPRIAELNSIVETGTDISTKQSVFGFLNPSAANPASAKPADTKSSGDGGSEGSAPGKGTGDKGTADKGTAGKGTTGKETAGKGTTGNGTTGGNSGWLSQASSATKVSIGGKSYLLFAQPSPVEMGSDAERGVRWGLVLVGLRLAGGVEAESHAMPYTVLIWAGLCGVVLLGLSWPWFKLQYMSNTERFRPIDGWILIFTLLLVSSGVMLMLLNGSYLSRSRQYTDGALRRIALQMKKNFSTELSQAFTQLEEIRSTEEFRKASKNASDPGLVGSYPIEKYRGQKYPYFEIAFWADCRGQQVAKVDIRRVPTPAINLNRFPFYRVVKAKAGWTDPGTEKQGKKCEPAPKGKDTYDNTFFHPVMSPNTNEFAPVLASPFSPLEGEKPMAEDNAAGEIAMQALVFRPMSVIEALLPPGYAFAVIDGGCNVLFHSDTVRDLRENFCEESKDRTELRPWQVNGADTALDITYGGRTKRAYLTNLRFPGLSAGQAVYLLVYQEGDQQLTLDMAVIAVCSILMGGYFVLLCLAVAGHFLLRGYFRWYYAPRIVWPCQDYAPQYLQIFFLCLLLCWLYRSFYHNLHEATLLALTVGVAILSVMFAIVRLTFREDVVIRCGIAVTASALLLRLVVELVRLSSGTHISDSAKASLLEWSRLLYLPMTAGVFAIVVCWPNESLLKRFPAIPRLTDAIKKGSRKYSDVLYALATVSLMFCISVVPCAGFFKYAYDAVSELSLKHDEAVLSERVIARRDRIANFYRPLKAPQLASQRLAETLDRYDKKVGCKEDSSNVATFVMRQEPTIEGTPGDDACPPVAKEPPIDMGLNNWIEKRIAQATFWFPSNELGSEISRLGVAGTDEDKSWERYWREPSATKFALQWKEKSRAPNFRISAEYPESHGLETWARVALVAFVGVMVLWFTNLAKMIFLTGVEGGAAIEIVYWEKVEDIKRDSLVIGLPRSGKSAQLRKLAGLDPRDFRDLRDLRSEDSSASKQYELERAESRSGVIVLDQFDFNMRDAAMNEKRLELVERLLDSPGNKLVLVSTVDPMYFLAEERETVLCDGKDAAKAGILLERWARALDKFSRVRLHNQVGDEFAGVAWKYFEREAKFVQFARWICEECDSTPMLRKIGVELMEQYEKKTLPTREQLVELVAARADTYYRMVWAGLTSSERLVLYQLALDGWSNPKNTAAIHQLEQKKLIFRRPMYRIMNDSFRRFIRSSEHEREILSWQKTEQQSTWQALRFVIIAAIIGAGVWLLYAQAQLFQIGTGTITAIAALLTAVAGFTARARRTPTPPAAEPPSES
jgi:hypothetical protein